jgi:hypothetical protein
MDNLRRETAEAADVIDAAVFIGDEFLQPAARAALRELMGRWERGLREYDNMEIGDGSASHNS